MVDWQEGTKGTKAMAGRVFLIQTGTKVGPDQLGSLTSNRCKKNDIRPPEITLVLIFKITMVILCRTSNSFGLQNRFSLNQMWAIRVDLVQLLPTAYPAKIGQTGGKFVHMSSTSQTISKQTVSYTVRQWWERNHWMTVIAWWPPSVCTMWHTVANKIARQIIVTTNLMLLPAKIILKIAWHFLRTIDHSQNN